MSAEFVAVLPLNALAPGEKKLVQVDDKPVLLLRRSENEWLAFEDYCPHRAGPLSEGEFTENTVTCPWHGACFDLTTGQTLQGPGGRGLKQRSVQIEGDQVFVSKAA